MHYKNIQNFLRKNLFLHKTDKKQSQKIGDIIGHIGDKKKQTKTGYKISQNY